MRRDNMKKIILFLGILFVIFIVGSCGNEETDNVVSNNYKELNKFYTDNKASIVGENNFSGNAPDQLTSGKLEYSVKMNIKDFYTIWSYNSEKDDTIDLEYLIDEMSNDASLVYISPNNDIRLLEDEITNRDVSKKLKVKKGNNRIKVVAKDTSELRMSISLSAGEIKVMEPF